MAEMALGLSEQQAVGRGVKDGCRGFMGHGAILPGPCINR